MENKLIKGKVGIDVGGTKLYMIANYNEQYYDRTLETGIKTTKEELKQNILKFINDLDFEVEKIGIGLPGLVIDNSYLEVSDVLPNLNGLDVNFLENDLYKVKFINDVKAAALVESKNYPENNTVVTIMVGTGIAVGVTTNGKLFEGGQGFAGEAGYAYIPYNGGTERFNNLSSGASILKEANCKVEDFFIS